LSGISIDGRLDDWPKDLRHYPIRNQLLASPLYESRKRQAHDDLDAYFMVGYDPAAEVVYLAVVVRDNETVVAPTKVLGTDAVEVYIDGSFSGRTIPEPDGNWRDTLDAATMPALQYAAVPGPGPVYGDPSGANPSLVYGRIKSTATKMKFQRAGAVTTYEWAIQAFDRYPDRPSQLYPGKRLGFDVAVVDKDNNRSPPAFVTWGSPPRIFKGCDAASLGELILVEAP
jgi:hypothetical protein